MTAVKKVAVGAALGMAVPAAVGVAKKLRRNADGLSGKTREQLYEEAKRLTIEGRSNMNKAELERAISRARS
jgi:hypothetical protein